MKNKKICVLSGKGGTGKTTIAVNLAYFLSKFTEVQLLDLDVEAPNDYLFFKNKKPSFAKKINYKIDIPYSDNINCRYCGKCEEICAFNSISVLKNHKKILFFYDLCHSCKACYYACSYNAIKFKKKKTGVVNLLKFKKLKLISGVLNEGEMVTGPFIEFTKKFAANKLQIIDSSPGVSCSAIHSLRDSDIVIMVTEPTNFGLYDLSLAYSMVKKFNKKSYVIINRSNENDNIIEEFTNKNKIKIILKIPYDKKIAKLYSKGKILAEDKNYENYFKILDNKLNLKFKSKLSKSKKQINKKEDEIYLL